MIRTILIRLRRRLHLNRRLGFALACFVCLIYYLHLRFGSSSGPSSGKVGLPKIAAAEGNASAVKEMTRFAWRGYIDQCALNQGGNELAPVTNTCSPESDNLVGVNNLLTVIDSLDTLILMGLTDEVKQGRDLLKQKFNPLKTPNEVNVFETTIRLLGGLLGAFSLTEDAMFARLATQVGEGLAGAFSDGRFPHKVKMANNSVEQTKSPFTGGTTNPAEVGSLYLEFAYLAEITGDRKFFDWVDRNQRALLSAITNQTGLLTTELKIEAPWKIVPSGLSYSAGAEQDSFYEYLVKRCLFDVSRESNCVAVFTRSLDGIMKHLAVKTKDGHICITAQFNGSLSGCSMQHLTCFAGGMFALAYLQNKSRTDWLEFAERVTETCYLSYLHSPTRLGPEQFAHDEKTMKMISTNDIYLLRPETAESIYYLYHVTGKQMYRDWGWNIVLALNSTARTASGFSGLKSMTGKPAHDNVQWSFFLAETLKYLYLLFSSSDKLPMDQWLFNTEAHILPSRQNQLHQKLSSMHSQQMGVFQRLGKSFFK